MVRAVWRPPAPLWFVTGATVALRKAGVVWEFAKEKSLMKPKLAGDTMLSFVSTCH